MGFMDKAMDRAMDKLEERFGALVTELNELDGILADIRDEQRRTNTLLEELTRRIGGT